MKLQFKEQQFQVNAVKAVVDCFGGQPSKTNHFTLERTKDLIYKVKQANNKEQFIDLEYEVLEEIGYRNGTIQITENQLLTNIQNVQKCGNLFESQRIERPKSEKKGYNLTIEMETGTGKTYTYIRTMYELHKHYGWSKFIVVVPRIAIREGVYNSFQVTQSHFQQLYGHKIKPFIYNSQRPQDIENFAADNRISVMIINTQAFNARGKDARRIYQELDQFGTRKPIDIIAQTNPILIIDEPQSVDGKKTLESMQDFNPLFTLRYSATHKIDYNKIYRLDALDAYHNKLVKKIEVKGINIKGSTGTTGYLYLEKIEISHNHPPLAVIEFEQRTKSGKISRKQQKLNVGANLYELSGNMPAYKHQTITDINAYLNRIIISGEEIYPGDVLNEVDEFTFRRIQIRETILSHLQKEKELYDRGIKVLSLFFIDSVEKYRKYDENGDTILGDYAKIFEEEYNKVRSDFLDLFHQEYNDYLVNTDPSKIHRGYMPDYVDYLQRDTAKRVHEGYFSIDKKNRYIDPKIKRGSEESDDISAYDLIMRDKERLLSLDEPIRFIFSHSALKEGWDNPNVFQICALKHADKGSEIRRRQEVGRGMRLCVNKNGYRIDSQFIGEDVHKINKLTVIASESYESFAKGLQNEIAASLKDRPQNVTPNLFINKIINDARGEQYQFDEFEAQLINNTLILENICDVSGKITPTGKSLIEKGDIPLPDNLTQYKNSICKILKSVYSDNELLPANSRNSHPNPRNNNFRKKEFINLWNKINLKSIYEVHFNSNKLIEDSKIKINAELNITATAYEIKTGILKDGTTQQMREGTLIDKIKQENQKITTNISSSSAYDIVGEIESRTHLTRHTIVEILKSIKEEKFMYIRRNPEEFISQCSKLINEAKANLIINNIVYHKIDEHYDAKTIFTNDNSQMYNSEPLKKHIYDYLTADSKIEAEFAQALEFSTEVLVYAKLPKSFFITTPIAKYSPDWAIVFDKEKVKNIYFVAETKGSDSDMDLREIEKLKIHCATEHFKEICGKDVIFHKISGYDKLLEIIRN